MKRGNKKEVWTDCDTEINSTELARLAREGGSFDFLSNAAEDIYNIVA